MKPDYKGLAEKYREKHFEAQLKLGDANQSSWRLECLLSNKEQEIEELKAKYSAAMDKIIELQEKLARITKGSDGGA